MPKYALLKDDVVVNVVNAEADWVPPKGLTKELFDKATHRKPTPPAPTSLRVTPFRFLFQLHSFTQRRRMDAAHRASLNMSDAETKSKDATLRSAIGGYPILALQVIADAYEMMDKLPGYVDVLSDDMGTVLQALTACGVYTTDPATIAAEVARIKANELPASAG